MYDRLLVRLGVEAGLPIEGSAAKRIIRNPSSKSHIASCAWLREMQEASGNLHMMRNMGLPIPDAGYVTRPPAPLAISHCRHIGTTLPAFLGAAWTSLLPVMALREVKSLRQFFFFL